MSNYTSSCFCSVMCCPLRYPSKTMFCSSLLPNVLGQVHVFSVLFIFSDEYLYSWRFPFQIMLPLFNRNTKCVSDGAGNAYPSGGPDFNLSFLCETCVAFCWLVCLFCLVVCHCVVFPQNYGSWLLLWYLLSILQSRLLYCMRLRVQLIVCEGIYSSSSFNNLFIG